MNEANLQKKYLIYIIMKVDITFWNSINTSDDNVLMLICDICINFHQFTFNIGLKIPMHLIASGVKVIQIPKHLYCRLLSLNN